MGQIYMLTNPIGQIYIGQTRNFQRRMQTYKELKCKSQKLLYKSLLTYGFESHTQEILMTCPDSELDYYEIQFICNRKSCYRDHPQGLNILKESYEEYKKLRRKWRKARKKKKK
jgi:group I intron endonuclease